MATTDQVERRKLELVKQLEESRRSILGAKLLVDEQVAAKKAAVREALNFPQRIKQAFLNQPVKASAIAAGSGLLASIFLRGKKKKSAKHEKAAKRSVTAALSLAILKPILQRAAIHFYHRWLEQREAQKALAYRNSDDLF
jgi:hypothetical protein